MTFIEKFSSTSPRRQLLVATGLAVVLCAVLVAVYFLVLHKPYGVLFSNLRAIDAATIVAELDKKKTPYRLEAGGATILVPADKVDATRLGVLSQDLPLKGVVGFELFNKSDMGLTEFAQKINYQRALQGELARTIMSIDGIDTARVHLSLPETTIFRDDRRPPKASVAVLMRPNAQLSASVVRGIQRLVAAAVPDLDAANVVVVDDHGTVVSGDAPESAAPAVEQRRAIEQYYSGKILAALDKAFPKGGFAVSVSALRSSDGQTAQAAAQDPATSSDGGDAFDGWTPNDRKFQLKVEVANPGPLSAKLREQILALVGDAIQLDPALGDAISVTKSEVAAQAGEGAGLKAVAPGPLDEPRRREPAAGGVLSPSDFWTLLFAPVLVALVVGCLWLIRRTDRSHRLSEAERREYVRRLSVLVKQEGADAVGRL